MGRRLYRPLGRVSKSKGPGILGSEINLEIKEDINGTAIDKDKYYTIAKVLRGGEAVSVVYPLIDRKVREQYTPKYKFKVIIGSTAYQAGSEIDWCDETQQWEFRHKLIQGYYDINKTGKFIYEEYKVVPAYTNEQSYHEGRMTYIASEDIALKMGFRPMLNSNAFYLHKNFSKSFSNEVSRKRTFNIGVSTTHHANEGNAIFNIIKEMHEKAYAGYVGTPKEQYLNELIAGLSYGIEFETGIGAIHKCSLGKLGLVPLVDGSLSSRNQLEYTTIPLRGVSGLNTLKKSCIKLNSQCTVDRNCAMHIHIGSLPTSKLFLISLYHLFERIQEELFEIVPAYKKEETVIMGKNKNYSGPIRSLGLENNCIFKEGISEEESKAEIDKYAEVLFKFISGGESLSNEKYDFNKRGTFKPLWDRQWNCPTRYFALNFVNYFFSKSGTVEFRLHGPTLNFHKTSAWLLICTSIVRYAMTYPDVILRRKEKINLRDILFEIRSNFGTLDVEENPEKTKYFEDVSEYLISYVEMRKQYFQENYMNAHKINSNRNRSLQDAATQEFRNDTRFSFSTSELDSLY